MILQAPGTHPCPPFSKPSQISHRKGMSSLRSSAGHGKHPARGTAATWHPLPTLQDWEGCLCWDKLAATPRDCCGATMEPQPASSGACAWPCPFLIQTCWFHCPARSRTCLGTVHLESDFRALVVAGAALLFLLGITAALISKATASACPVVTVTSLLILPAMILQFCLESVTPELQRNRSSQPGSNWPK